ELLAFFEAAVAVGRGGEREDGVDDGVQAAGPGRAEHGLELVAGGHRAADDLDLPPEEPADVDLDDGSRGGSVGNEASPGSQGSDASLPGRLADVLDDHVDPALPGIGGEGTGEVDLEAVV